MAHPLLSDPFVSQQVESAIAPFLDRLMPDELDWMRDQLAVLLQNDPEVTVLLKGSHPRGMDASGERGPLGIEEEADDVAVGGRGSS